MDNTLTQKAYKHLHKKLSTGQLRPGSRLSNRGVAKEVGMSFTPVREALSRLVSEGLLEYRQGLGVFVPTLSAQEIRENYELREILESEAAVRVCRNLQSTSLAEVVEIHECMVEELSEIENAKSVVEIAGNDFNWQAADRVFHKALLCITGNRRLLNKVESLWVSLDVMTSDLPMTHGQLGHRFPQGLRNHIQRILNDHGHLLQALKQSDANATKTVMTKHIRSEMELALASHAHHHMNHANPLLCHTKMPQVRKRQQC